MRAIALLLIAPWVIGGCTSAQQDHVQSLAQVSVVVAALKCAFSDALMAERANGIRRLEGAVAAGKLTFKAVHTNGREAGAKLVAAAPGPFVFPFAGGSGNITGNVSRGVTRTDTLQTEMPFRFVLYAADNRACDVIRQSDQVRYGLSEWLAALITGANQNIAYDPPGQIDAISFDQDFAVTNVTKGGLDFNLVFLSLSASVSAQRNDVQHLSFTIAPASDNNPPPTVAEDRLRRLQYGY
ncbi:MAG TPA: hypothetical protein VNS22_07155 [Geminicoccus sp.]|uniref:hypothetical protein n=1 Tax=Geminicoccus sp. TaxID=2024832 RepID=UPI002D0A5CDC|nr:hypothetical protein [Geminicoccus sp.]HWL68149.1 hypothetical protein [Geminicoccus sp.]